MEQVVLGLVLSRADFGFGNPNNAGAFFAIFAMAAWALPRVWLLRPAVCLACLVMVCATASRGALLAAGVGLAAAWLMAGRPMPGRRALLLLILGAVGLGAMAIGGRMGERMASMGPSEGSTGSRLAVLSAVPAMVRSAREGWGIGNAAEAYHNWFQSNDDIRIYKHLLSTHATWVVEIGWVLSLLFIFAWAGGLAVTSLYPAAFGVWAAWFVACVFNHVGWDWRLWVVPLVMLGIVVGIRQPARVGRRLLFAGCATLLVGIGLAGGVSMVETPVRLEKGTIFYGEVISGRTPWYFRPSRAVLGQFPGKRLRMAEAFVCTWDWDAIPPEGVIVLSGEGDLPKNATFGGHLVWLNPVGKPGVEQEDLFQGAASTVLLWGALRTETKPGPWRAAAEKFPSARWKSVPGAGLYLSKFPDFEE